MMPTAESLPVSLVWSRRVRNLSAIYGCWLLLENGGVDVSGEALAAGQIRRGGRFLWIGVRVRVGHVLDGRDVALRSGDKDGGGVHALGLAGLVIGVRLLLFRERRL